MVSPTARGDGRLRVEWVPGVVSKSELVWVLCAGAATTKASVAQDYAVVHSRLFEHIPTHQFEGGLGGDDSGAVPIHRAVKHKIGVIQRIGNRTLQLLLPHPVAAGGKGGEHSAAR